MPNMYALTKATLSALITIFGHGINVINKTKCYIKLQLKNIKNADSKNIRYPTKLCIALLNSLRRFYWK